MDAEAQAAHERQRALGQISNYDSENAYMLEHSMKPPPPRRTVEEMNLSVIQRHHPEVTHILTVAPYAVIYEFETIPEPTWEKKDIEGSLFICQLAPGAFGEDRFAAIVLNRRGLKNFDAPLIEVENGGVEVNDPYVIITFIEEGKQKIYGVFIFSEGPGSSTEHARTINGNLMVTLANAAGLSRKAAEASAKEAQARHTNGHLQEAGRELQESSITGEPMSKQISLQQLFGEQRQLDAGHSGRTHHYDGSTTQGQQPPPRSSQPAANLPQPPSQQHQTNALLDLFKSAGGPAQAQPANLQDNASQLAQLFQASGAPPQRQQPPPQRNVLADLFRNSGVPGVPPR